MKKSVIALTMLTVIITLTGCSSKAQSDLENAQFDYYVECTTKEQLLELENESFVDSIFPFSLLAFERPGTASQPKQIAYFATESFDRIDTSSFDRSTIVKEDASILSNYECNPIIISSSLAKDEHLSIGDTMEQPCKLTEQPLKFTVGAIYDHDSLFAQYEAVILLNEENNAVLLPVIEEAGYTNAYIEASNLSELSQYFEEEFIPGLICIGVSEEEIAELTREDIEPYYENYESHVKRMN